MVILTVVSGLLSDILLISELLLIVAFLVRKKKSKSWFLFLFSCLFLGFVVAGILKEIIHFPRPLNFLGYPSSFDSFPSRHSTLAAILSTFSFYLNKKLFFINLIFTLLIGTLRVLGLYHWFGDVIAGFILGILIVIGMKKFFIINP